jgi:hypothetical protein
MARTISNIKTSGGSRSKTLLVILSEVPFFGLLGFDRFYMQCYKSGAIKLGITLLGILLALLAFYWNPVLLIPAVLFGLVSVVWYIVDVIWVAFNAVTMSESPVFCDKSVWTKGADLRVAQVLSIIILVCWYFGRGFVKDGATSIIDWFNGSSKPPGN